MLTKVDALGRVVIPKSLRDSLGLKADSPVDISLYGEGLHISPIGRTARLREEDGRLVADSDTTVTDELMFGLIDKLRT